MTLAGVLRLRGQFQGRDVVLSGASHRIEFRAPEDGAGAPRVGVAIDGRLYRPAIESFVTFADGRALLTLTPRVRALLGLVTLEFVVEEDAPAVFQGILALLERTGELSQTGPEVVEQLVPEIERPR